MQPQQNAAALQPADDTQDEEFDLALHVSRVEDWEEATDTATKLSERDRDYYDNKQLTSEELAELNRRGQPDVVFNKIRSKINYLLGLEITSRTDPRAMPRNPKDEEAAAAATDALRYVEDETDLDQKFTAVWENELIEGYGGIELTVDEQTGDVDAVHWSWDRLFYDVHSRRHDFTDATYLGGVTWMDVEQAKAQFRGKDEVIDKTSSEDTGKTLDDKPKWKRWTSGTHRKRVKIIQMYYKKGADWYWCIFTKGGKLDGGPVPFKDEKGLSWCPLFMQSAYVDRENNRYGECRAYISPQDEINKRRSKSLHLLTQRQTKGEKGAVEDVEAMKQELAKPDGHVEVNPGYDFEILDTTGQVQGNFEMMQQAMLHMETEGANAALMGKQGDAASGRAIQLSQSGGQIEISPLVDRHTHLKTRVYRGIWNLIRQYKKEEWWVRVTDNEDNVRFVGFNRPVTMREEALKRLQANGVPPDQAQMMIGEIEMDPMRGPMLDQVIRIENVPAEMDMDITIEHVPDVANSQQEQFEALVKLAPTVIFPPEIYIKASSLRNKRELLDELKGSQENPEAAEYQKRRAEAELAKLIAETEKIKAETVGALAKADQTDAETGQIVNPAIIEPGGGPPVGQPAPQQLPSPAPQPGF